jgi:hypothetical protein
MYERSFRKVNVMARNPESNDKYMQALDFIITFLREHEQKLDKLNSQLATVISGIGNFDGLNEKLDNINQAIAILQQKMEKLTAATRKLSEP